MKYKYILILLLCTCTYSARGDDFDFAEPNIDGDTIYYKKAYGSTVRTVNMSFQPCERYDVDTFHLPVNVKHNGIQYTVDYTGGITEDGRNAYIFLEATKANPTVIFIPSCFPMPSENNIFAKFLLFPAESQVSHDLEYAVDPSHPHLSSEDGIIFSKDKDTLVLFPITRKGTYNVPSYVKYLSSYSFLGTRLDTLNLADNVDIRVAYAFLEQAQSIKSFRYPNSVTRLEEGSGISGGHLEEITFGSGLTYLGRNGINSQNIKYVYCLAVNPPQSYEVNLDYNKDRTLFVPCKSIGLYKQARGWKEFNKIEPIEPPVVARVNEAEISWVTNAEASSYTLTIYLDEAQTKRLVTLSFDDRGYLTKMDFNPDVFKGPHRMPQEVKQLQEEDYPEFNKYLTFTVTGLTAHTKYYFVRQTLNAMSEVIDEEIGSFETLPDGAPTGIDPLLFEPQPQKTFENGMLRIRKNGNTYNVNGTKVD